MNTTNKIELKKLIYMKGSAINPRYKNKKQFFENYLEGKMI